MTGNFSGSIAAHSVGPFTATMSKRPFSMNQGIPQIGEASDLGGQIDVKRKRAHDSFAIVMTKSLGRSDARPGLLARGSKIALLFWAVAKQPAKAARKQPVGERLNFAGPQDGRLRVNRRPFLRGHFSSPAK